MKNIMRKILLTVAISCMPFIIGTAQAVDPSDPYARYTFNSDGGFERMGFGFAQPIITIIPGYTNADGDAYRPVVIIAGGYDPTKDYIGSFGQAAVADPDGMDGSGPTSADSSTRHTDKVGNAVYFVDAVTGDLVARVRSTATTVSPRSDVTDSAMDDTDQEVTSEHLKHSIPATVTIVDSQGDGITDRVYFVDVAGNIWRLDLIPPGANDEVAKNWKLNKFASLGVDGVSAAYDDNDRRFFNQIDVVRTRRPGTSKSVDALLVGSGNIANPKGDTEYGENKFFVIYDENTQPTSRTLTAITMSNLLNASAKENDDSYTYDGEGVQNGITGAIKGWYWDLEEDEKVVSAATTINGVAYFTTIEASPDEVGCQAPEELPASYLYAFDMHTAEGRHVDSVVDGEVTYKSDRRETISDGLAFQQIDPFVTDGGDVSIILPGDEHGLQDSDGEGMKLKGAGSYWRTKDQ